MLQFLRWEYVVFFDKKKKFYFAVAKAYARFRVCLANDPEIADNLEMIAASIKCL